MIKSIALTLLCAGVFSLGVWAFVKRRQTDDEKHQTSFKYKDIIEFSTTSVAVLLMLLGALGVVAFFPEKKKEVEVEPAPPAPTVNRGAATATKPQSPPGPWVGESNRVVLTVSQVLYEDDHFAQVRYRVETIRG